MTDMEQPQSSSHTTGMSPELYEAAMIGNIGIMRQYIDQLDRQFTPTSNTLLHVLAQFSDSGEYVKEILNFDENVQTLCSILLWVNTKGETVLHVAARNGRVKIVNVLLEHLKNINKEDVESEGGDTITKKLLRMKTKVGDTALHEAIKFNHQGLAELLFKQEPEFVYPSNNMDEKPLYLAAEKGNCQLVHLILLDKRKSAAPSYDGPCNMTALHAAIRHNCEGCTGVLLKSLPFLTKKADAFGWTALHLAARCNLVSRISQLLKADPSLAYITAGPDSSRTPLQVATAAGKVEAMAEILRHNPDCWEINSSDDRNLLHIAVDGERVEATKFILGQPWAGNLTNEKDSNGDTPLHLYAVSSYGPIPNIIDYTTDVNACNKENFTPIDLLKNSDVVSHHEGIIKNEFKKRGAIQNLRCLVSWDKKDYTEWKERRRETRNRKTIDFKKMTETYMIVSTLIATVTFAAAFTLPGGYNSNDGPRQGMAVLTKRVAFQVFMISNTTAVVSSILAIFLLLLASSAFDQTLIRKVRKTSAFLLRSSMIAMLTAFTTGSYCVLDYSSGLQISICLLGGIGILGLSLICLIRPRKFGYIF